MALHLLLTTTLANLLIYSSIGYKLSKLQNYEQENANKKISSKIQEKLMKRKTVDSEMIIKR